MVQMKTGKSKAKKEVKKPTKPVVAAKEESSEEEESDSEEEEKVVTKATPKANNKKGKAVAKQESEEEDSDEDDDDSEEEETKAPSKTTKKAVSKKAAKAESSDDDDDDDEDDSDEEVEKKAKKNGTKEKVEDDEDDDDDDDDDDDEDEEEDKEKMEVSKPDKKRKQNDDKTENAKKAKSDETVTMGFSNLPEGTDDDSFNKFLKSKGIQCISCRANYSRGRAFVDISADDKGKAIGLNQVEWKGSELEVAEDAKRSQQAGGGVNMSDRDARTMFVRNLPYSATEEEISELFENVEEVRILIDRQTGNSKGICFVQFDTPESLKTNMEKKDGVELQGRSLYVDYAGNKGGGGGGAGGGFGGGGDRRRSSGGGQEGKTLFVKGITEDMTQDSLLEYFDGATEARMPQDNGKNKFFAYIEFASADQAMKVYKSAKGGIETNDGNLMVDFAKDKRGGGDRGRGGGGFRGGRGRGGGFGGGRGGGGYGGRGGGRGGGGYGGRGGGRGGGFGGRGRGGYGGDRGRKTTFNDSD